MPVYRDEKNSTWKVYYRYTDWDGKLISLPSAALRPSVMRRHGSVNSIPRAAAIST